MGLPQGHYVPQYRQIEETKIKNKLFSAEINHTKVTIRIRTLFNN